MSRTNIRRVLERTAWVLGLVLLLLYVGARLHGALSRRADLARFQAVARAEEAPQGAPAAARAATSPTSLSVDTTLWSEGRIKAYEESLEADLGAPLAVLRIPRIGLEVPVREGTDDLVLNRAVGRIQGTAQPGGPGNLGLAGHRDGFFRGLKDLEPGDELELETPGEMLTYRIDDISIVLPEDVHVLAPTQEPAVTLVTCYPFYFVGSAPKRYIVRATLTPPSSP